MAYKDHKKEIQGVSIPERVVGSEFEIIVGKNQTITVVADCEATTDTGGLGGAWTGGSPVAGNEPTMTAGTQDKRVGTNCIRTAWAATSLDSYALFTLTTAYDMSGSTHFGFWASHSETNNNNWDAAADFTVEFYDSDGTKVLSWEMPAATEFLNCFRLHGDVPHYFEILLSGSLVTGQDIKDVKSIRFVASGTEKENSKYLYIDRLELYDWGTGAGPLRGGKVRCFEFSADVDRGLPVGLSADPILCTLRLGQDNDTTIRGVVAEAVDYSEEPNCWVITEGVVNLIAQETFNAGEGAQLHGAASNTTGYDVDDGAADAAGAVFAKFEQTAVASGQHPALLHTGYGTYNA